MDKDFNIQEYKKVFNAAKKHFEDLKVGKQDLYREQSKLFTPITDSSKELQDKLTTNQKELTNALLPLAGLPGQIQKSIEQVQDLQTLPYYGIPEIKQFEQPQEETEKLEKPRKVKPEWYIDLDSQLDENDRENLIDMALDLPSEVHKKGSFDQTLEMITKLNRQHGQFLGAASKKTQEDKEYYKSLRATLEKYDKLLKKIRGATELVVQKTGQGLKKGKLVKQKRGRGRPKVNHPVIYVDVEDLCTKLDENVSAYKAGNKGLHNTIVAILDELLENKYINKNDFDTLFKNIFSD